MDSSLARRQQKIRLGWIYYYLYLSVFIWWQKSGVSFRCAKCLKAKANRKKKENCFHYTVKKKTCSSRSQNAVAMDVPHCDRFISITAAAVSGGRGEAGYWREMICSLTDTRT